MKFTLNRDHTVSSVSGHTVRFDAHKPTFVPKSMHHEVLAIGAVAADLDAVEFDDQQKGAEVISPADPAERAELIRMMLADIQGRDNRDEFTANGVPKMKAVVTALGFEVTASEIGEQWKVLLQEQAGTQGD